MLTGWPPSEVAALSMGEVELVTELLRERAGAAAGKGHATPEEARGFVGEMPADVAAFLRQQGALR